MIRLHRQPRRSLRPGFCLQQPDPTFQIAGIFDNLKLNNVIDVSMGGTFEFAKHATLGIGLVFPVTSPRPFDLEALAQLNYRF
jgi:hypothetical protein